MLLYRQVKGTPRRKSRGRGYKARAIELKSTDRAKAVRNAETAEFDECAVHHKMQDDETY